MHFPSPHSHNLPQKPQTLSPFPNPDAFRHPIFHPSGPPISKSPSTIVQPGSIQLNPIQLDYPASTFQTLLPPFQRSLLPTSTVGQLPTNSGNRVAPPYTLFTPRPATQPPFHLSNPQQAINIQRVLVKPQTFPCPDNNCTQTFISDHDFQLHINTAHDQFLPLFSSSFSLKESKTYGGIQWTTIIQEEYFRIRRELVILNRAQGSLSFPEVALSVNSLWMESLLNKSLMENSYISALIQQNIIDPSNLNFDSFKLRLQNQKEWILTVDIPEEIERKVLFDLARPQLPFDPHPFFSRENRTRKLPPEPAKQNIKIRLMKKERAAILKPNPPTPSPSPQSHQVEAEIQTPKPSPSPKPGPPLHEPVPLNLPERRRPRAHHPGSDTPPTPLLSPTVDRSPLFSPTPTRNQSDYSDPKNRSRSSSPTLSHSSDALNSATPARTVQKSKRRTATGSTADRGKARMKPGIKKRSNHGFTRKNGDDITAIRDLLRNKDDDEPGQPILRRSTRLQAREISTLLGTKEDDGIEEQMANDEEAASPRANIKREAMQQALDQFGRLREEEWMTRLKEKTKLAEIGVMGLETLYDDVIHRAPPNSLEADLVAHRERERVRIAQLRTERAKKEQERKEKIVEARRNAVPMPELYDLLVMKEDHDQLT